MTRNLCQDGTMEREKVGSLCGSCKHDGACIWQVHAEHVGAQSDPHVYQRQIIDDCTFFDDSGKDGADASALIFRHRLHEAGVRNLCGGCPSAMEASCTKRKDLDRITGISSGYGNPGWVHVSVVTCRSKLRQISEPGT